MSHPDYHENSQDSTTRHNAQMPADTAPNVEWALYFAALGWHVMPLHSPIFDANGHCTGCSCEDYKRSDANRKRLEALGRGREYDPNYICESRGKHPRHNAWEKKATTDATRIRRWWWGDWKDAGIGIAAGPSGLLVVDEDSYKDGYQGDDLDLDGETLRTLTGGGGVHLYYQMPEGKRYGNQTGDLPAGIDIRGWGGFVVAAPSLHESGRRYQWELGYSPEDRAATPMPEALCSLLDAAPGNRPRPEAGPPDDAAVATSAELVQRVLAHGDIAHGGASVYRETGRKWILNECPFMPEDDPHAADTAAAVFVLPDGTIGATCFHARCQHEIHEHRGGGWRYLRELCGYETAMPADTDKLASFDSWLRSPVAIEALKEDGNRNPEKARKLLDVISEIITERNRETITPGYGELARRSGISQGGIGGYLARLFCAGRIELYPGGDGKATGLSLVFHGLNGSSTTVGYTVQPVKNWNLYREFRGDELFIQGHHAYTSTRIEATLKPFGDAGLAVYMALHDGPLGIQEASEATGHSYQACARIYRRMVEHGLVDVDVGQRNRKTFTLKDDYRRILHENRPKTTTYGVMVQRRIRYLKSRIKWHSALGHPDRAERLGPELERQKELWAAIKEQAHIIPFKPDRKQPQQERLTRIRYASRVGQRVENLDIFEDVAEKRLRRDVGRLAQHDPVVYDMMKYYVDLDDAGYAAADVSRSLARAA